MDQPNDILLSVENLQVHFIGDGPVARAVDGVDFHIRRQETVCIVGESGCGKTVTALAILGLLKQRRMNCAPCGANASPWFFKSP
jgi:ABC-type dipeptide/oligopeptide/nickel transport system ATPase component